MSRNDDNSPSTSRGPTSNGAAHAAKAVKTKQVVAELSPKNIALIQLLDSWLNKEVQEEDEAWERLERVIDENRLSSRKFFT